MFILLSKENVYSFASVCYDFNALAMSERCAFLESFSPAREKEKTSEFKAFGGALGLANICRRLQR